MKLRHSLLDWVLAVRPWSFPASAMPVIVTIAYHYWNIEDINWVNGIWALVNIVLFHAAANTWSDYFDFKYKVDAPDTFGATTLSNGDFLPKEIMLLSIGLLIIAVAGGIGIFLRTGLPVLYIGLCGVAATVLYPLLKYHALGDVVIFITYAILPTLGTSYVAIGLIDWRVLWLAMPVGLITVAILHINNTRDIVTDRRAGIMTVAMILGDRLSSFLYCIEVLLPFCWVAMCIVLRIFPIETFIVSIALVPAIDNIYVALKYVRRGDVTFEHLDEKTARLQILFSTLFALSFVIAALL